MSVNGFTLDNGATIEQYDYEALDNIPTLAEAAQPIIETYAGSTLAGSARSVKSAVDLLNSAAIAQPLTNTDLDTLTTPDRVYYGAGDHGCTNVPDDFPSFHLDVVRMSSGYIMQVCSSVVDGLTYRRWYINSSWRAWSKDPTRAEVDTLNSKVLPYNYTEASGSFLSWVTTTFTANGSYYVIIATTNAEGLPAGATGIATVTKRNADWYVKVDMNVSGQLSYENRYINGAWIGWRQLPTRAEVDDLTSRYGSYVKILRDKSDATSYTFAVSRQSNNAWCTFFLCGPRRSNVGWCYQGFVDTYDDGSAVSLTAITNDAPVTLTVTYDGTNLAITASGTLYGGVRLIWLS